jgi:large repetitive protein
VIRALAALAVVLAAVAAVQGSQATFTGSAQNANGSFATASDWVAPTATSIAAANKGTLGTTAGKLDSGDTITFTFSEAIDPATILSGWSGASTTVRVRFVDASSNDTFTVQDSSGGTTVKLGTVTTNGNYVTASANISSTMVRSADGKSVVVTLGTPSNVSFLAVGAKNMSWALVAGPKDTAGNALATPATRAETDTDVDF